MERGSIAEYDASARFMAGGLDWRTWVMPVRGPGGTVTHLISICNDLTLAGPKSDLRNANRQLSLALQALKGASCTHHVETGFYTASDAFVLLMGENVARPVS